MGTIKAGRWLAAAGLAYMGWRALRRRAPMALGGKVVLITGGSRGLGLLLAKAFAREGCRIAICARDAHELERARAEIAALGASVLALPCDLAEREWVDRMVEDVCQAYGHVDILVNNASIVQVGPVESMTIEDFEAAMNVNFWGAVHTTLALLPQMRQCRRGSIVNIDSIGGRVAIPHLLPYSCAKFALRGFSEGLRAELAPDGIHVTTVLPGLMRTGSPLNAYFKGDADMEYTWFSLADNLLWTSMDAEDAADRIVEATRYAECELTLSWQAKALGMAHDLLPQLTIGALTLADRMLPRADRPTSDAVRGRDLAPPLLPESVAKRLDDEARRFNQYPEGEPSPVYAERERL